MRSELTSVSTRIRKKKVIFNQSFKMSRCLVIFICASDYKIQLYKFYFYDKIKNCFEFTSAGTVIT